MKYFNQKEVKTGNCLAKVLEKKRCLELQKIEEAILTPDKLLTLRRRSFQNNISFSLCKSYVCLLGPDVNRNLYISPNKYNVWCIYLFIYSLQIALSA